MNTIAIQLVYAMSFLPTAGAKATEPGHPDITSTVENSVLVVRHGAPRDEPARIQEEARRAGEPPESDAELTPAEARLLNRLQDFGLIHIHATEAHRTGRSWGDPPWKYTPKEYHGYHPKPDWKYRNRAGWRYDAGSGWRHRPEPSWLQRPGALSELLAQLPTRGATWYVTRWQ